MSELEKLSAVMDDESHDSAFLAQLGKDAQLQQKWQRYHLVGNVMREETPSVLHFDISAAVAQALQDEPTVLAPRQSKRQAMVAKVVPLLRQSAQYAIAASVAAAVLVGVQRYGGEDPAVAPVINTFPIGRGTSPVSLSTDTRQGAAMPTQQEVLEQRQRIHAFLQDHQLQTQLKAASAAQ